jgi:subtilisin family serine protease
MGSNGMKKMPMLFTAMTLSAVSFHPALVQARNGANANKPASVPGELLVQFYAGSTQVQKGKALGRIKAEILEKVVSEKRRNDGAGDLVLIRHQPDFTPEQARKKLESDPSVEFVEPNWIYTHQAISDDTYYLNGSLWGMYGGDTSPANQFGSGAVEAWAGGNTNCGEVWVGIIDEGYMYTHEDLAANAGKNPGEIPGNKVDDDGNGYVDDVYGWDFDGNNNTVYDGSQDDHGTHVAGTIGAVGGNGKGVAGICWNVKLINAKFLGRRGGTTANAIKAVDYMTDLKQRGINLVATNNSWGGGGYSQGLYDAIDRANAEGILFVAAAGNGGSDGVGDNNDATPHYPSSYANENIISVAAITNTGAISSFSNYGATSVDIGAPGSGIYSTLPGNSYGSYSGTSMATPHVTGAAALYKAANPSADAAAIKSAILSAAVPTSSLAGKTVTGGRLNVSGFFGSTGGGGSNQPPIANFTVSCTGLSCTFDASSSSDSDGTIVSYDWNFDDGTGNTSSSSVKTSHLYSAGGTYNVTLTVTDDDGSTGAFTKSGVTVTAPESFSLSASGYKVKGVQHADLSWNGATSTDVDIYRNSIKINTTKNDGADTDKIGIKGAGTYTYKVCDADSSTCSNEVTVIF